MLDPILFYMMNKVSERQNVANRAMDQVTESHRESRDRSNIILFVSVFNLVLTLLALARHL